MNMRRERARKIYIFHKYTLTKPQVLLVRATVTFESTNLVQLVVTFADKSTHIPFASSLSPSTNPFLQPSSRSQPTDVGAAAALNVSTVFCVNQIGTGLICMDLVMRPAFDASENLLDYLCTEELS